MPVTQRTRRWVVPAIAALMLLAIGMTLWPLRRRALEGPATMVAPSGPLRPPSALFARMLPSRAVELVWSFDPLREPEIAGFHVNIWSGTDDLGSISVGAADRSLVDRTHAQPGRPIEYVVAVEDRAGEHHHSELLAFVLPDLDGAPPAAPAGVTASWRAVAGRPVVEVHWTSTSDNGRIAGYRLYADDRRVGALQPLHDPMRPVAGSSFAFEPDIRQDRDINLAVVAVDRRLWESESSTASVPAKAPIVVAPGAVTASRDAGAQANPVIVRWTYDAAPQLVGFRVFEHGLEVANEQSLNAEARSWSDAALLHNWDYAFEVQAVFADGRLSPLGKGTPLRVTLSEQERRPPAPQGLVAQWIAAEGGPAVRVMWNQELPGQNIARHVLSVKPPGGREFEPIEAVLRNGTYDYRPPARQGDIAFRLEAIDKAGRRSAAAETDVPSASALLMPARLIDFREGTGTDVTVIWKYPASPVVRGFRLFRNGRLVADEQQLGPGTRSWTLRVSEPGRHTFELEAVAADGGVSLRGTGIDYDRIR